MNIFSGEMLRAFSFRVTCLTLLMGISSLIFTSSLQAAPEAVGTANIPRVEVMRVPDGGIQPQVVADASGTLHLIYFKGAATGGDLFYARSSDGGSSWSAPLRVNTQPNSAIAMGTIRGGQLCVGRNGIVHVVWNGSDAAQPRVKAAQSYQTAPFLYARLVLGAQGFTPQRNLMTRTLSLDGGGAIAADDAGKVWVFWHANTSSDATEENRQVWVARSQNDGETFAPEAPVWDTATGVCGCCSMKALWSGKQLYVLYRAATGGVDRDMYALVSSDGQTFRGTKLQAWQLNACPMTSAALVNDDGKVLGAWETQKQVYYGRAFDPQPKPQSAPGTGDNRKHPVLAVNASGQVLLAWTEGTGWNRGGRIAWQLFTPAGEPIEGASGTRDGLPVWGMAAAWARPDGTFEIVF